MSETGVNKSAILLLTLGENEAAEVMKHLEPWEVQKISTAMAGLKNLSREQVTDVFKEFHQIAEEKTIFGVDANGYIRKTLNKALGAEKAAGLLGRIMQGEDTSGIESLKWMDTASIAEMIGDEHPQIIATILVHLEPEQSSGVLKLMPERLRNDVLLRIATLDSVQPAALRELNSVLTGLLSGEGVAKKRIKGGVRTAAEILNFIGSAQEETMIEAVRVYDPDLAQKIVDEMFVFEDILGLDDRAIQLILREIQSESLIIALKGSSEELCEKIFNNMSHRAAEILREDLEAKGPVRVSEVEAEQKEIIRVVRRLSEEGQIEITRKGEEAYV